MTLSLHNNCEHDYEHEHESQCGVFRARARNRNRNYNRKRTGGAGLGLLGLIAFSLMFLGGCSRLIVESNPPGADVLWSPNGAPPWRPWPPLDWSNARAREEQPSTPTTPLRQVGPYGDYVFITVNKPGYHMPRPRLAGLYIFRSTTMLFDLEETPGHFAESQRAKGLALYKGQWVDPAALGLVQWNGEWMAPEEKHKREMIAKGLVEWDGQWLTPGGREVAYRQRQQSLGLVEFKNDWMTPRAAARVRAIDAAVTSLDRGEQFAGAELSPPKVLGQKGGIEARIGFRNSSAARLRWLLSGPSSRVLDQAPHSVLPPEQTTLTPGRYTVAVFELAPGDPPLSPPSAASPYPPTDEKAAAKEIESLVPAEILRNPDAAAKRNLLLLEEQPFTGGFAYSFAMIPPVPQEPDALLAPNGFPTKR